jgi:hypothetical protein
MRSAETMMRTLKTVSTSWARVPAFELQACMTEMRKRARMPTSLIAIVGTPLCDARQAIRGQHWIESKERAL